MKMPWLKHAMYALMCRVVQVTTLFPHYVQSSMTEGVRISTDPPAYLDSGISPHYSATMQKGLR